jgi:site-specific recombinase XerD
VLGRLGSALGGKKSALREKPREIEKQLPVPVPSASPAPARVERVVFEDRSFEKGLTTQALIRPEDRLKQSIEAFLLDQRSPHTRTAYAKDLKRFVQYLLRRGLDRGVERLDRSVLVAYKESLLSEGLQHTTVDRHLATLRSFFGWLQADGLIERNPAESVRFMNARKLSTTIGFSDEEVRRILVQPNLHTRVGAQHYAILMVLFYCGLRRSELCELRISSLFTERDTPVLRLRGKGNKERIVPLTRPVHKAIQYYFRITGRDRGRRDSPLFIGFRRRPGAEGEARPLDPSTIFYIVTKYAKLAGVESRVSPHSCRATAISNARDHQVPDRAIQEFAGWASTDMITRYDKRKSAIEESAAHAIVYGETDRLPEEGYPR